MPKRCSLSDWPPGTGPSRGLVVYSGPVEPVIPAAVLLRQTEKCGGSAATGTSRRSTRVPPALRESKEKDIQSSPRRHTRFGRHLFHFHRMSFDFPVVKRRGSLEGSLSPNGTALCQPRPSAWGIDQKIAQSPNGADLITKHVRHQQPNQRIWGHSDGALFSCSPGFPGRWPGLT